MANIELRVLGGGHEVGRSAIALGVSGRYLLLDYGVNFNEEDIPQFPLHIRPSLIDGVVLTHAHLDHIGAAPLIYSSMKVPTITSKLTKTLIRIMIEDFLRISGYYIPYEVNELDLLLENTIDLDLGNSIDLGNYRITLLNAGHIPGSSMALVETDACSILYTGDINSIETKLVKPVDKNVRADVVIIEATYGNTLHPPRDYVEREFINSIKEVIESGGNVLIPVFSLGRAQEVLSVIYQYMPYSNVYYDGMVRQISGILVSYPEYINMYGLLVKAVNTFNMVRSSGERRRILKERGVIIVASAGMLKGGPAQYYAKHLSSDSRNGIFLVSYQAKGTPGRRLLEYGVLNDDNKHVKAKVLWFDFSSHADYKGLIDLITNINNLHDIVVVHTNEDVGSEFVGRLRELNGGWRVHYPGNGESINITI